MDKYQNMASMLGISVPGYTIEMGNTNYKTTLEERIQAARAVSSSNQMLQKYNIEKSSLMNNRNTENVTNFQNIDINKRTNNINLLKLNNRQQLSSSTETNFESTTNVSSLNSTIVKNRNINLQAEYDKSCLINPIPKGSLIQHRLELIKSNKKLSNITLDYNKNVSTKCTNNLSQSSSRQDTFTKNHAPNQYDIYVSKGDEFKTSSSIQKKIFNNIRPDNCISNNTIKLKNPATSVQYRLIRAKEEMNNKSKCFNNNFSNIEIVQKSSTLDDVQHNNNILKQNIKNKTKKLSRVNETYSNNEPTISSTPSVIQTDTSKILGNEDILKELNQKELNSFSFVMPQTNSVQQRLEKRNKDNNSYTNTPSDKNDSMDWEYYTCDPINIVDQINDLRKTAFTYEPMEWDPPDTIMHSDFINHCLVIDTNILLLELKSLTIIIDKYLPEYNSYLTIVLPWQVLQELDYLKKIDNALSYQSREAIRWLLEMLSNNHPRLKGQPMVLNNLNADDSILKCAMIVKERVNYVTLVTDDKILSIKSEVNGVPVKNSAWLQNLVLVLEIDQHSTLVSTKQLFPTLIEH